MHKNACLLPHNERLFFNRRGAFRSVDLPVSLVNVQEEHGDGPVQKVFSVALDIAKVAFFGVAVGKFCIIFSLLLSA